MFEGLVRQARNGRQDGSIRIGDAFHGKRIERGEFRRARPDISRRHLDDFLAPSAHMLKNGNLRTAEPAFDENIRRLADRPTGRGQRDKPVARLQMGRERMNGTPVQRDHRHVLLRPAEPCSGQRKSRGRRDHPDFVGTNMAHHRRSDPEVHRVTGGEDGDRFTASFQKQLDRLFHTEGPRDHLPISGIDFLEDTCGRDHCSGCIEQGTRRRRQAVEPVIADAEQRQPRLSAGFRFHLSHVLPAQRQVR